MGKKNPVEPFADKINELRKRIIELEKKQTRDVAAYKRAEKALRDAHERMGFAQRSAKVGIWNWDIKTDRIEWSPELFELFGLDGRKMLASRETWEAVLHRDDRESATTTLDHAVKNCSSLTNEYRIVRRDGQIRWISAIGQANPERISGVCIDITDRKQAENAFRKSNERLKVLSEIAKELLVSDEPMVIERICRKVMAHINCDVFFHFMADGEKQRLRLNVWAGISGKSAKKLKWLDYADSICGFETQDAGAVIMENIPALSCEKTDILRRFGLKAFVCHPLMSRETITGTLSFGTRSRPAFSEDDLNMMKAVADQVALAIEREKTVEALHRSREILEQRVEERTYELKRQAELLDLAHDAIIVRDSMGTITFWSSGAEKVYGWTRQEAIGSKVHKLLHTKSSVPLKTIRETTVREGRWDGELIHTTKDRRKITVLSRWALEKKNERSSAIFLEMNSDITERKQAEDALRLTGIYNRNLIEASLDPLVTISVEGKINDVNTATELVTGFSRDDLIGTDFSDYFTDPKKARAGYKLVFKEGFVHDYELEVRHRDGHITPVIYSASIYRDETGRIKGVFAAARDITKRKEAEEELTRRAAAIEQSADGITITDTDGTMLYANSSFLVQTGYSREELLGRNIEIVRSGKDANNIYRDVRGKNVRMKGWSGEVTNVKKDGTPYDAYMTISPVKDPSGRIINYVSIVNDITEKKRFEKQLQEAQKMQAIGTMAGGVAHDFNNIIAGIIGFTEMTLEDAPEGSPSQRRLQLVLKGAYRGRDLVRQILAFSRRGEHEKRLVSMRHIVEEVSLLLRASLPSTIEIRKELAVESDAVMADQTQIHQVILNLCSNAAHAMREKGGTLSIELADEYPASEDRNPDSEVKPGRYVRLTIHDTGCGIEQKHLDHIFEPFYTTKSPGEGTGLGLSVVHGIIKNHDGFVKVYSKPGKGSSFHVFLPEARSKSLSEAAISDSLAGGSESILFVDDEELLAEMGQQRLKRLGYKATSVTNALKALEVFRADPTMFDLVITDYTMPHMTGLDLANKLHRIRPDIPIILCSGLNDPVPTDKLKKAGIVKFITKPFGKREFSQAVRGVLDIRK